MNTTTATTTLSNETTMDKPKPKTLSPNNVIALPGVAQELLGAVTYWRMSGECRLSDLEVAWRAQGLDEKMLPSLPSPRVALTRAVNDLKTKHRFARRFHLDDGTPGWAIIDEKEEGDEGLAFDVAAKVYLSSDKLPIVVPEDHSDQAMLVEHFRSHRLKLAGQDVSAWLTHLIKDDLGAVSLRDTGGVYFTPREQVEVLNRIKAALKAATHHQIHTIPSAKDDDAVESIMEAVRSEAARQIEMIEAALDAHDAALRSGDEEDKPLGKRALGTKSKEANTMIEKLKKYEGLLGQSLGDVSDKLKELSASSMEAVFALDQAKDE